MTPAEVRYRRTKPPKDCKGIEALVLAGHPDLKGLCQALVDWSAELRIIEQETCADQLKARRDRSRAGIREL